jgi:protein-tyrosine sulfotransferase
MSRNLQLEEPVLIGGCGSSGTTLLRHLINAHPNILCGSELSMMNKRLLYHQPFEITKKEFNKYLQSGLPTYAELDTLWLPWSTSDNLRQELRFFESLDNYGMDARELVELVNQSNSFLELINSFFEYVLNRTGKIRWAEKTPSNCYCINNFLSCFPKGYYVHVVRDGRDVVPSLIKRGYSAPMAVRRWMYDTATGLEFRGHPRYREIRYEELTTDPQICMRKLFSFIGETAIDDISTQIPKQKHDELDGHSSWTLQPNQSISSSAVGKWMSDGYPEKTYIQNLFKHTYFSHHIFKALFMGKQVNGDYLLSCLGYDLDHSWDSKISMNWKIFRHYIRELRGRDRPKEMKYFVVKI